MVHRIDWYDEVDDEKDLYFVGADVVEKPEEEIDPNIIELLRGDDDEVDTRIANIREIIFERYHRISPNSDLYQLNEARIRLTSKQIEEIKKGGISILKRYIEFGTEPGSVKLSRQGNSMFHIPFDEFGIHFLKALKDNIDIIEP